ncbi:hypothetical protein BT63DRAFT_416838 [Microthyrium microscopicum]|uniref:Uncharacterized protein n=1 Tax=Microthyrium microscopicum TaxID=703497 RepID=A0A6A6U6A2_9PEZI|nr:hypothetical protein BT63DRAFT_416838 [Microthyrium microscopicum]
MKEPRTAGNCRGRRKELSRRREDSTSEDEIRWCREDTSLEDGGRKLGGHKLGGCEFGGVSLKDELRRRMEDVGLEGVSKSGELEGRAGGSYDDPRRRREDGEGRIREEFPTESGIEESKQFFDGGSRCDTHVWRSRKTFAMLFVLFRRVKEVEKMLSLSNGRKCARGSTREGIRRQRA